ncbi:guanine deaminase [Zymomonas mobilis subsp. mobilis ZM4 = ATCC 31821]|uniref:Guanine deaminase n=1 Tax=Zymomonas mobilis subsp. mobilis (strain ATCC 31821 / ZM4 / CP4) TaxID=264203 RepID=Q5NNZ7_ZYMMO|nr:guanine deaminase [Zymomonas mobilis]AAV89563.1 guanine deaminase [Zymomonas mobilis subsp. mobilis ZM4 = ATCC 31821]AVZ25857.1 guanine deaminase [Zymomonas mobilis subsp. mobilis]AVZ27748.1 guanine deaminase [Zymomonas mobilis subsp. mobilis]AVZ42194.1 guanine deaminase [Zymomonas mobilis subsp. mobilis ZM4 = ATCC 31821]UBQ06971.1 guanine deaminase [Zymomonas mobilis]
MRQGFRGEIISFTDDPSFYGDKAVSHQKDGIIVVENGRVIARDKAEIIKTQFPDLAITDCSGYLIMPGFIDSHIHYTQLDCIAAGGETLLGWLEKKVFPTEQKFSDKAYATETADFFLKECLRNGTTSALVFATSYFQSVEALYNAALKADMRIITGNVLMDLAPKALADKIPKSLDDSEKLIQNWQGHRRLGYAVTPRFALTSSSEQLAGAGKILGEYPDILMQTHLAETKDECAAVKERFPKAGDYLEVYENFGLLTDRSVFAHCLYLSDSAFHRLAKSGAGIAFCPTSNLFLGSGLFNLEKARQHKITIGLGSDVGAGTSFSLLATMAEAYKTCRLQNYNLDPFYAFYLATLGGARLLGIDRYVGSLGMGQEADFILVNPAATPLLDRRTKNASLEEKLFALEIMGDDRAIAATYIKGKLAFGGIDHPPI